MMKTVTIHAIISGKVQGVFFRANTQQHAQELGVNGWIRNKNNGDVECVATGNEVIIEQFCEWLKHGPPTATVDSVKIKYIPVRDFEKFIVK